MEELEGDVDVFRGGEPQYRIELRPRALSDFEPTCWWRSRSPDTPFTQWLVCSLLTDDADLLAADRVHFGIELDRVPTLRGS